ncbi:hypothetical protein ES703_14373 [subsurface metagenome]
MKCEYCQQENADTQINDHWYHKDCYIRFRSQTGKLSLEEGLPIINCCTTIIIIIVLIWLINKLWPILK